MSVESDVRRILHWETLRHREGVLHRRRSLGSVEVNYRGTVYPAPAPDWREVGKQEPWIERGTGKVFSRSFDDLVRLYSSLSIKEDQTTFMDVLCGGLAAQKDENEIAYLISWVMWRMGLLSMGVECIISQHAEYSRFVTDDVVRLFSDLVRFHVNDFTHDDLEQVERLLSIPGQFAHHLDQRIVEARLVNIETKLRDPLPEIIRDKEEVISVWRSIGGLDDLVEALSNLDVSIDVQVYESSEYMKSMLLARAVMVQVCREQAERIEKIAGKKVIGGEHDEHRFWRFLQSEVGVISQQESSFLSAIYTFASLAGLHKVSALREHARIVRNIVIEMTLMLLRLVHARYP